MQTFTNKFTIALNHDKTEAMINFYQNVPIVPENPPQTESDLPAQQTQVAGLAMTGECFQRLSMAMQEILSRE